MLFQRAAVIGIGLIGGSFALAARQRGLVGHVTGVARTRTTLDAALRLGAADDATSDAVAAVAGADLVYLATPVRAIPPLLQTLAPALTDGCLVTDAGSTKREVVRAAAELPGGVHFIGGHPLAGSEQSGVAAARADLFEGASYFITPGPEADEAAVRRLSRLVEGIGACPVVIEPELHDHLLAATSHLPHVVAAAVCAALADTPNLSRFAGSGVRDTTRIAAGPADVWRDILLSNADEVRAALARLMQSLAEYDVALAQADGDRLVELLELARGVRGRMDRPCDG